MRAWTFLVLFTCLLSVTSGETIKAVTSGGTIKGKIDGGKYLYDGKEENTAVVEYKEGVDFKSSKAPKVIVFYSPYCG